MSFFRFFRDRLPAIFIYAAVWAMMLIFLNATRCGATAIVITSLLYLLGGITIFVWDFFRRRSFYDRVLSAIDSLETKYLVSEMLPDAEFADGEILCEILTECCRSMYENIAVHRRNSEDFREFIELWVHEIKLPIASLLLMAHNNKSEISEKMHTQLRRIDGYTDQVLYYARSENAEKDYIIKEVQLKRVVSAAAIKNKEDLLLNSVQLNISELDFTVRTDSKWLEYIISQFMANSMKYRSPDREPEIDISAEKTADSVVLKFRDNGIGIPESDMPYIFGKSFTGENGRTHNKSTGMGLYIVHNLCQRLGHRVEAESVQGEFTEFRIIFGNNSFLDLTEL